MSASTFVCKGASASFLQSGRNSSSARGSNTLPETTWAPTSEAFSSKQTEISLPVVSSELFEADRRRQPRGAAADNDHIIFHAVPLDRFLLARRRGWRARRGGRAPSECSDGRQWTSWPGAGAARARARSIMRADRMGLRLRASGCVFAPPRAQRTTYVTAQSYDTEFVDNQLAACRH